MKMNKKTIIILIVVAVAAFLLWKRRKSTLVVEESETLDVGSGLDPNSLEDCITAAFGNDQYASSFRDAVLRSQNKANSSAEYKAAIKRHAEAHGWTYQQELTYQGTYEECARYPDSYSHKVYLQTVKERLDAM